MKLGGVYRSRGVKVRDVLIGFVGWWVINGLAWLALTGGGRIVPAGYSLADTDSTAVLNLYLLPLNILLLFALALLRRWMALGVLLATALNLVLSLALSLTEYGSCGIPFFMGLLP